MKDNGEERKGEGDSGERICAVEKKESGERKSGRGEVRSKTNENEAARDEQ